jgi:hypothetical protein
MKHTKNMRAYIRPLRDYAADAQRRAVESVGTAAVYVEGEIADARAAWLKALRPNEVAVLPSLEVLAIIRSPHGPRPSADFSAALSAVQGRCAYIVDARTGITSQDGQRWLDLVAWAAHRIAAGRALPTKKARAMARKRWKDAEPGTVARWLSPHMDAARHRWAQHWRDPKHGSEQKAFDALPDEIKRELGSKSTARRIFNREE